MGAWERFADIEGATKNAVEESRAQSEPLPTGTYKMRLEEIQATQSKEKQLPMLSARFRVLDGEKKNKILFYNQVLLNLQHDWITAKNIAEVMSLISGLVGEDVEYEGLPELKEFIGNMNVGIVANIDVSYGAKDDKKSFPILRVVKDADDLEIGDEKEDVVF